MIAITAAQVAEAVSGRLVGVPDPSAVTVTSVATDSREVVPGTLFVAKPGESTDGHRFLPQAAHAGAVLNLTEREVADESGTPFPSVVVEDVVLAMGALASHVLEQLRADHAVTVVAVSGSVGKTTTKDLLHEIFSAQGLTVAPRNSYNGEVGVPLTIFTATEETEFFVVEMGATHIGNIRYLCDMVRPDVGAVLCVGSAHAGEFGGVENIARAKGEMVEALSPEGTAVLNDDDARVRAMRERTVARVVSFGQGPEAHDTATDDSRVWAEDVTTGADGCPAFTLHLPDGSEHPVRSKLIGVHHVTNLLAAAAVAWSAGVDPVQIAAGLEGGARSRWRMERTERADGVTVINDAYNANPQSMKAALQTLAQLGRGDAEHPARRTIAVLGGMHELGEDSVQAHADLGQLLVRLNISHVLAVGDLARPVFTAATLEGSWGEEAAWVPDAESAEEYLREQLRPGDIVLLKSSNAAGLNHLGDRIAASGSETIQREV
ncbi:MULTISPECIES: UDP-N-acetylmuramoyl-tripeptide--D-alanyl-D-alanine ligase [unclassified Kocuria]|uniref:UDP-N-acetylmuramoyl-tripeptide--D-alanyl-D- alanine ligase n=1 Tax=unclassified Kocuria TaxID=2649579 RepID=UPI000F864B0A|nr:MULTISPECIES: UDP-N-acetylmuramoyl-tripeptide--D-alanyl-D-alanine ligase [unclassified Kocuria]RUP84760.1 UDP-N-acetylmuramoyl-tripeptide--D-alanyl-D-alanine ligase [Kocuria sp. HSID17590]RUQ09930.1 UDP-N-acetylmuramoyl-tripeptide--D-alanyl-D-alanine ligase [Kocuria sp. HSID17582]